MLAAEERQTTAALIGALGIAVLGALGTAVYRGQLGAAVSPSVPWIRRSSRKARWVARWRWLVSFLTDRVAS